jgi:hypothetical protein
MGLLDIIRGKQISANSGSATAIDATDEVDFNEAVAKVAVAKGSNEENFALTGEPEPNPDRYCWPHSSAMNSGEIDKFKYRVELFQAKGLDEMNAEALADKLVIRDRDGDDRKVCYECRYLKAITSLKCENWKLAGIAVKSSDSFVGKELAMMLQRCHGFDL